MAAVIRQPKPIGACKMKVYILMFVPYGCPSYDTRIEGVYATERQALNAKRKYIKENYDNVEDCPEDEVFYTVRDVVAAPKKSKRKAA